MGDIFQEYKGTLIPYTTQQVKASLFSLRLFQLVLYIHIFVLPGGGGGGGIAFQA